MIHKILNGSSILFLGLPEEILPLWKSAFNRGAIQCPTDRLRWINSDDDIVRDVLTPMGSEVFFSVQKSKIFDWRESVEELGFDVDRVETESTRRFLHNRVQKWLDSIPVTTYRSRKV